ncbi:MAG: sel1 repeat family protein [Magnetococcales bacterium]|nr:sel1 repeat family protein [Magnetococcales bacterium]
MDILVIFGVIILSAVVIEYFIKKERSKKLKDETAKITDQLKELHERCKETMIRAEQGDAKSQLSISINYRYGSSGLNQNNMEAIKWLRKSVEQGYAPAETELGERYMEGDGLLQDYNEGIKWLQKAAAQGDARAQYYLGKAYEEGKGVVIDYNEAVGMYKKAAEQGVPGALEWFKNHDKH